MNNPEEQLTGADAKHGYRFGCDGVVDVKEAEDLLGVCERTVWRFIKEDRFRHGKHPRVRKKVICRRSLNDYLASLEH